MSQELKDAFSSFYETNKRLEFTGFNPETTSLEIKVIKIISRRSYLGDDMRKACFSKTQTQVNAFS